MAVEKTKKKTMEKLKKTGFFPSLQKTSHNLKNITPLEI